jgi:hypothetical protein
MNSHKEPIRKIEEALKAVHRSVEDFQVSAAWNEKVMRTVRGIAAQPAGSLFDPAGYGRLVWRFSAATCLIALALMVYAMTSDLSSASTVTTLFFEDPIGVDLVHSLGIG